MDKFYIPISIVVAGVAVASALYFTQTPSSGNVAVRVDSNPTVKKDEVTPERVLTLVNPKRTENRYVRGDGDTQITIVEFSDFECPFCAQIHPTLERIVNESDGAVAWEYRHLPLSIHRNAQSAALAAECVGELAGNEAFWKFGDFLFSNQKQLSQELYTQGAKTQGISASDLTSCMSRDDIATRILEDTKTAAALGGGGTPFNVIIYEDGSTRAVPGALPYKQFKALVQR